MGTAYATLRKANVTMSTSVLVNGATGTLGLPAVLFALALGAPLILGVGRNVELLNDSGPSRRIGSTCSRSLKAPSHRRVGAFAHRRPRS
jgi:NADPH:quinone reductase-like Zn-dependent oxidoreductase